MVVSAYDSKLVQQLESEPILTNLLDYTLAPDGQNSSMLHGTEIVIALLRRILEAEEEEEDRPNAESPPVWLNTLFKYLDKYKTLLTDVPADWHRQIDLGKPSGQVTAFGFHRLKARIVVFLFFLGVDFIVDAYYF